MRGIYVVKGLNGGTYRGVGLLKDDTKLIPFESTHHKLGHIKEAYRKTAFDIIPKFMNNCNEELTIYTNNTELDSILPPQPEKNIYSTVDITVENYYYNKFSHNKKWHTINYVWELAELIGFDERYMCQPEKVPSPPYTVYTDASLWDNYNTASVGFVVMGSNGGLYSAGFPTPKNVQDNNVAECYAILSALNSIPDNVSVNINTDSQYALKQMEYIENESKNMVMNDIKEELKRFKNAPEVNHVSRDMTFLPDKLADVCKDESIVLGKNPRACIPY